MDDQRFSAFPAFDAAGSGADVVPTSARMTSHQPPVFINAEFNSDCITDFNEWSEITATAKRPPQQLPTEARPCSPSVSHLTAYLNPQSEQPLRTTVPWPYNTYFEAQPSTQANQVFAYGPPGSLLATEESNPDPIVRPVSAPAALPSLSVSVDGDVPQSGWRHDNAAAMYANVGSVQWPSAFDNAGPPLAPPSSASSSSPSLTYSDGWMDPVQPSTSVPASVPTSACSTPTSTTSVHSWAGIVQPAVGAEWVIDRRPSVHSAPERLHTDRLNDGQLPDSHNRRQSLATSEVSAAAPSTATFPSNDYFEQYAKTISSRATDTAHEAREAFKDVVKAETNDQVTSLQPCVIEECGDAPNVAIKTETSRCAQFQDTVEYDVSRQPTFAIVPSQRATAAPGTAGSATFQVIDELPPVCLSRQGPPSPPFRQMYGSGSHLEVVAMPVQKPKKKKKKKSASKTDADGQKKRQKRTAMACVPCRETKRRCDGEQPCGSCVRRRTQGKGGPCEYVRVQVEPTAPKRERRKRNSKKGGAKPNPHAMAGESNDGEILEATPQVAPPSSVLAADNTLYGGQDVSFADDMQQHAIAGQALTKANGKEEVAQRVVTDAMTAEHVNSPLFSYNNTFSSASTSTSFGYYERSAALLPGIASSTLAYY